MQNLKYKEIEDTEDQLGITRGDFWLCSALNPSIVQGQLDFPSKPLFAMWVSILESLKCSIWHIIKCELFSPLHGADNLLFTWAGVWHFDLCYLVGGWSEDTSGLLQAPGPFLPAQTWSIAERFSVCLGPAPLPFFPPSFTSAVQTTWACFSHSFTINPFVSHL